MNEAKQGIILSRNAEEQQKQNIRTSVKAALLRQEEAARSQYDEASKKQVSAEASILRAGMMVETEALKQR